MKKALLLCTIPMVTVSLAFAQQRQVTGKVAGDDGSPISFATIQIKGTTTGTTSDQNGNFKLNVSGNNVVLIFRSVGYALKEVPVGSSSELAVTLITDNKSLQEVVVTALGIKRSQKSVSYSVQQINADKLTQTRETNISTALAGKIAGVQIQGQSGAKIGEGAVIRLRGAGSLMDKNPLFVLDGTPISPEDINMDDVESVSVLKGPTATALYGQRADAGVVIVTTKKGKLQSGIGLEINQTTTFDRVYLIPDYQNRYSGGGNAELTQYKWAAGQPEEWKALDGKYYHDYSDDASWGPEMKGQEYIPWYAWYPGANFGKTASLTPQKNNVKDFYRTGLSLNNNVQFSQGGDNYTVRVSFTNLQRSGVMPGTSLDKNSISTQNSFNLGKHFTIASNIFYTTEKLKGEFVDGYSNNSTGSFNQWFHRDLDMKKMKELRDLRSPQGALGSWNHNNPESYSAANPKAFYGPNYWYNPFSYFDNVDNQANRNRLIGDINLTYKLNDHFRIAGFLRRNELNTSFENKTPYILEVSANQTGVKQSYATRQTFAREDNYEVLATYNNKFFNDLSVDLNIGGNVRKNTTSFIAANTNQGLTVPNLFALSNSVDPISYSNTRTRKTVRSAYGRGTLGWKEAFFVDFSIRNDISSALPKDNNSYWYPSVGASIVFSEFLKESFPALTFGKVRASWAQIGSDLDPYGLDLLYTLGQNPFGPGNSVMTTPNIQPNDGILPSLSSSGELGLDLKFFNNRVGASFTYYHEDKRNEILDVNISNASGFLSKTINAGSVVRSGVEVQLNGTPVASKNFNWETIVNFSKGTSKVVKLAPNLSTYTLPNTDRGGAAPAFTAVQVVHSVDNQEWGQLRGNGIKRNEAGVPILKADGTFEMAPNLYFGSVLPEFTGGWFNTFTYKDITLSAVIDFQKGGKYFSLSDFWGSFSGLMAKTAVNNDKGKPVRDPVADGGGVNVSGVDADGKPVKMYVDAQLYWHQFRTNSNMAEMSVYDASFIKLREVSLGYNFPVAKMAKKIFTRANISVVARNVLMIYADEKGFDPSELSGRFGENGQMPGVRSIGINLRLGF
ncbi:SusC/RagA family TonB-linked outer membrane protein [Chitinophaga niabensis]|uniref:TonB-linked outer membrane protein, SusC/RagA family n=1 Tax=Chitinophaga niabensis TaxID=536979 RepID=A0A1N6K8B5_9BACT|nr:SusC/RagA family TonB-linked outer membrane protein [Chitinophaga niabensis]SIO52829.1 TonB-linked outer membrane protein, SusC/RagA family [Chitinophaga niabensis]